MGAKMKLLKKDFKFLSRDIEVDEAVIKELKKMGNEYREKNKTRIEELKKQALQQANALYEKLQKNQKEREKQYTEDVKRLEVIIKDLEGQ